MSGPWGDFQSNAGAGPWDDFKPKGEGIGVADVARLAAFPLNPAAAVGKAVSGYGADAVMGARSVVDSLAQMLTRGLESAMPAGSKAEEFMRGERENVESVNADAKAQYERNFEPDSRPGAGLARSAGVFAATAPFMPALGPAGLLANIGRGAAMGAATAPLEPVYEPGDNYWGQKAKQVGVGAAVGAATGGIGSALAGAIAPKLAESQNALTKEGIALTPGQAAGGWVKGIEDRFAGIPLIGDLINKNRFKGITDFNRAIYARATAPFGKEGAEVAAKADVGNAGIAAVGDFLSAQYEKALARSVPSRIDDEFVKGVSNLGGMVPETYAKDFAKTIQREIVAKITPGQTLPPSVAKDIDSYFKQQATRYMRSSDAAQQELGMAYRQVAAEARQLFARNNPETAPMIRAADEGWATLVQMERAGGMLGAKDGIFTPSQLLNAIKTGANGVRKRQYSRGDALNQEFAQAADKVLPNKVPDSGTAGRIFAGVGAANAPAVLSMLFSPAGAAMALGSLPYMPGIGPMLMRAALNRPEGATRLADLARTATPYLAAPAALSVQP